VTAGDDPNTEQPTGAGEPQDTAAPGAPASPGGPDPAPGQHRADVSEDTGDGAPAEATNASSEAGPDDVSADLATAHGKVAALTDDLLRLQAEYVNYKRRVDRDRELVKQNATFSVLSAMLPVLDDLDRAREHGELEGGFKAVADSLERIVAAHGLVKFGAPGDEFDPRFHEALMHAHSPEVTTTTCQNIVSAGYLIGDRVVRPARVTVVDPEPEPEPERDPEPDPEPDPGVAGGVTDEPDGPTV
jgi:molecular chaperone GrpE